MAAVRHLRVEEAPPRPKPAPVQDVDHWRQMAVQTSERLNYAEVQVKDLRVAADEARARLTKAKTRLDSANQRINELNVQLVRVSAERDELRAQLASQEVLARKLHEFRQSLLNGPLWEMFVELAVSPPVTAGGETTT